MSPPALDWQVFSELVPCYRKIVEKKYEVLNSLLEKWNLHLKDLGGDPTRFNWDTFRPLRLSREEDWSDWLAHLLFTSNTGEFAHWLLQIPQHKVSDRALPRTVEREVSHKGVRADLIVEWRNNHFSHIEVKIGDENLEKTYETSEKLMEKYGIQKDRWTNFILLLPNQRIAWDNITHLNNSTTKIKSITWIDICIALRRSLLCDEEIKWKVWAYSFLGAVEQLLIEFPGHKLNDRPDKNIDDKIEILTRGLDHE